MHSAMIRAATARAPALLAAAALAVFVVAGFTATAQSGPVEKNCNPPPDGVWYVEGEHVVCVGGEITLNRLKIWEASTVEFHGVDLLLDTANTPEGTATVAVGADLEGYVIPSKLIIRNSHVQALDPDPPQRIDLLSHAEFQFSDSTLTGLGHGLTFGKTNTGVISSSTFINMALGITDGGATNLVIQNNFFDQVHSPIYTQGTPLIEGNTLVNCGTGIILKFDSAHPVIRDNTVTACASGIGQSQSQSPQEDIFHNDVFGNCQNPGGGSNIGVHGKAENNWWGDAPPGIEELNGNYHCVPEPNNPTPADYSPWLSSPRHPERLPTPTIASLPSSVVRGESVTFDASGSQPSTEFGFELESFEWNLGDGTIANGEQVLHAYQDLGTYAVKLHVKDEKGLGHFVEETVQVTNQGPEVEVSLSSGYAGQPIQATVEASDPDGDSPLVSLSWLQNEGETSVTQETVPGDLVRSGDTWRLRVHVTDSDGATVQESRVVEIPNRSPSITNLAILPSNPVSTDSLEAAAAATDPDEDPVTLSYEWRRNGEVQAGLTGSTVPASHVHSTDTWRVTVTAADAQGAKDSESREVTVANRQPVIADVSVSPVQPRHGEALQATVAVDDPDQDPVTVSYAWYEDGAYSGITMATVPGQDLHRGRDWHVVVTASDGYDDVTETSAVVTVQNTAPSVESLALDASKAGEDLVAEVVAEDVDGDAVSLSYAWMQNGATRTDLTQETVPGSKVVSGDTWRVRVTPSDGELEGDTVSVQAVIGNHAPVIASISVEPASPTAATGLQASIEATDADGDDVTVSYAWQRNGQATSHASSMVPEGVLQRGESWRLRLTATDGKSEANALSEAVVVANTAPSIDSVSVEPDAPVVGQEVHFSLLATDVDGDALTVTWTLPDGTALQAPAIDAAFLGPGTVTVAYTVFDGTTSVDGGIDVDVIPAQDSDDSDQESRGESDPSEGVVDDTIDNVEESDATDEETESEDSSSSHGDTAAGLDGQAAQANANDGDETGKNASVALWIAVAAVVGVAWRRRP